MDSGRAARALPTRPLLPHTHTHLPAQALPLAWLFVKLRARFELTLDRESLAAAARLLAPTGLLVLRTAAITGTYAAATALAARAGPAAAAAHQVAFQLWLASSLLADSLAVACQTLLARRLAEGDAASARAVADRCVLMAAVLGVSLAAVLAAGRGVVPGLFSRDGEVLALVGGLLPAVIASQPLNALAFVWDGVLFGAGGFRCGRAGAARVL